MIKRLSRFNTKLFMTFAATAVVLVMCVFLYNAIYTDSEIRCNEELKYSAEDISGLIESRLILERDNLESLAENLAYYDDFEDEYVITLLNTNNIRTLSTYSAILLPDERVIINNGRQINAKGKISFKAESVMGAHISGREKSILGSDKYVIRNFVPVVKDGKTKAMLFGAIEMDVLAAELAGEAYGGKGRVSIADRGSGSYIIDTWSKSTEYGNIYNTDLILAAKGYSINSFVQNIRNGLSGTFVFSSNEQSNNIFLYYLPLSINNWVLGVSVPEETAFGYALSIKRKLMIFFAIVSAVLLLHFLWMVWSVDRAEKKELERNSILRKIVFDAGNSVIFTYKSGSNVLEWSGELVKKFGLPEIVERPFENREFLDLCGFKTISKITEAIAKANVKNRVISIGDCDINVNGSNHKFTVLIENTKTLPGSGTIYTGRVFLERSDREYLELSEMLYKSSVEGLYNRRYYDEKLKDRGCDAFAIIDLDRLKYINDRYGHLAGDEALRAAARAIVKHLGNLGVAFRYGGDEFCICVYKEISFSDFKQLLEDILEEVGNTKLKGLEGHTLTLSIGGYYKKEIASESIKAADLLLYEAKKTRNKVVVGK